MCGMGQAKYTPSGVLEKRFSDIVSRISELAAGIDIQIRPFYSSELPFFSVLSTDKKNAVIHAAFSYLEICERCSIDGKLSDSTFVWDGIKSLGLRPTSDLFNLLTDE